jgi:hypothetical protein
VGVSAPTERYVKIAELAVLMRVSERTINRWVAHGMPSETWGLGHTRRFLPSQTITWARAREIHPKIERNNNPPGRRSNATGPSQ